jgi:DNA-binding transcriptional ArsR family regulator
MSAPRSDDNTQEAVADDTVLTDVLGPHAKVKILVALVDANNRDLNASDVARLAGIDRSTFYDHIEDLMAYDLIEVTRRVGNSKMYRIDRENPAAEDLAQLEWDLLDYVPE